jgi:hypothetical protein
MDITLEEEYKNDPDLLEFYKVKLLDPGWAGELTENDAEYIARRLSEESALRGAWRRALKESGYTGRRRRKPSAAVITGWNNFLNGTFQ